MESCLIIMIPFEMLMAAMWAGSLISMALLGAESFGGGSRRIP